MSWLIKTFKNKSPSPSIPVWLYTFLITTTEKKCEAKDFDDWKIGKYELKEDGTD